MSTGKCLILQSVCLKTRYVLSTVDPKFAVCKLASTILAYPSIKVGNAPIFQTMFSNLYKYISTTDFGVGQIKINHNPGCLGTAGNPILE